MPKQLRDLHMKEISGVDRAANLAEGWLLMKSATPQTAQTLARAAAFAKGIDPDAAPGRSNMPFDREALAKEHPEAAAYIEGLEKHVLTGQAPAAEPTEEEILAKSLSDLPKPLRKAVLDAQRRAATAEEEVRKERDHRELEGWTSVAKSLTSLPDVNEATGSVFQKAVAGDRAAVLEVIDLLKKADAVVKASAAFSEIGSAAPAPDSPEGQLAAFAKQLTDANPSMDYATAMEKAAEANPDLYRQYRADMNRKNRES